MISQINYLSIIAAAVVSFGIGMAWYSPFLFARPWMRLSGLTDELMRQRNPIFPLTVSFTADLVLSYVLLHFMQYAGANSAALGLIAGFWAWLGFIATVQLSDALFTGKPFSLFLINTGYRLASLLAMGAILGFWA